MNRRLSCVPWMLPFVGACLAPPRATRAPPLQLDFADLDGSEILPVAGKDFVLVRLLELHYANFGAASLGHDPPAHARPGGIAAAQHFLVVCATRQDFAETNGVAHLARQGLHLNRIPGRNPVLFSATADDRVHTSSRSKRQTLSIGDGWGFRQQRLANGFQ